MENYFSKHNSLFFLLFFAVLFPQTSWALRPYSSRMALVAGTTSPGFQDGDFLTSTFNRPLGITINPDGTELFISDTDNNRIRIVHLDQKNNVTTLSGGRQAGNQNGSLTEARFNKPQQILYLPGDRLAVNDAGNKLLRLVDLKAGTVSTLAGSASATLNEGPATQVSMSSIQDMAYFSDLDSILLAFYDKPGIKRLDLKSGTLTQISSVPTNGLNQLKPGALLVWDKKVYLSDSSSPKVFAMELNEKGVADPVSIATAMSSVIALAQNGGILYALQRNDMDPMDRLLPYHYPVTFVSDWGDAVQNPAGRLPTFKDIFNNDSHMSFVTDPNDKRKFYLLNPSSNIVTSFRDLFGTEFAGGDDRNYNGFNDFAYPEIKPPHTFRIMLVGDSRPTVIHMILSTDPTRRQLTLCKRMETELNMLAAIDDQPLNYEVEFLGHSAGNPLFHWPTYEVPPWPPKTTSIW